MFIGNNIPQGYKQTELGIIPEDWEVKPIGDLGRIVGGGTPSTSIPQYWNGGIAWYTPAEIGCGKYLNSSLKTISELGLHASSARLLPPGTILLTTRASIGLSAILQQAGTTNQGFQSIIVYDSYDNEFVYYLLQQYIDVMYSLASGSTFLEISKKKLALINVAFPINRIEQRAIAKALSDIDGLIAALDKKIAKKRLIKQGAMQQLLTGKKRLPGFTGDWIEIRLGDYTTMNSGGTPSSSIPEYYNGDIPFLSISDITISGKYIKKTEKTITKKGLKNSSARMFPRGTIMYAMYASLGKTSIADIELSCSQAILGITPNDKIDNNYLYYCLSFIENNVKEIGQTGTQTNLSKQIVQDFLLYIPNQGNEQQAIATILTDMDKEIADLEAKRDKYRLLKSGMMQKLLTGQIRLKIE